MNNISLLISIVALLISSSAFLTTLLNYRRKSSIRICGMYQLTSNIACEDKYISKVILENKKDKAVTIYAIYLKIYPNYYIELSKYDEEPLIIKPYETHKIDYGQILYYSINLKKIVINHLFDTVGRKNKYKIRIVLSTSEGKYVVKRFKKYWTAILEFFKNQYTEYIIPIKIKYKDEFIGSNIRYLVIIKINNKEQIIQLREKDYEIRVFKDFNLTKESLENENNLKEYLAKIKSDGLLLCDSFEVIDSAKWKEEVTDIIEAPVISSFKYYILGKIGTWLLKKRIHKQNLKNRIFT